jgi:hypothetical protein
LPKTSIEKLLGPLGENVTIPKEAQFVGVGTDARAVMSLAQQRGVDVLLIANVAFKVFGVNRTVDANLTVRLVDVATEKRLWASKMISSNQVKAARSRNQPDPSRDLVRGLSEYLETNFQLQDKPSLDSTKARLRAEAVAREEPTNPLPALVEVRYYQLKGLLTPLQAESCYQRLVDAENAGVLANGKAEERQRVIERFLPRTAR